MFLPIAVNKLIFDSLGSFSAWNITDQNFGKIPYPANSKIEKRGLCPDALGEPIFFDWIVANPIFEYILVFFVADFIEVVRPISSSFRVSSQLMLFFLGFFPAFNITKGFVIVGRKIVLHGLTCFSLVSIGSYV